jgi:homoserine O-acetyltransferase
VLAINSADDERNPSELGTTERARRDVPGARLWRIPASPDTRGHATTMQARLWKQPLLELLQSVPPRAQDAAPPR